MSRYLLDTDHFTLLEMGHLPLLSRLLNCRPDEIVLSLITVEEAFRGRLASVARAPDGEGKIRAYGRLARTLDILGSLAIAAYDSTAEGRFQALRGMKLRVGTQDLRIAAVALASSLVVVTRNRRDFGRVPGLDIEDWSGE